jgi:membrane protein
VAAGPAPFLRRLRNQLAAVRDRSPAAAHGVRAVDRYLEAQGALLAAAVSYYGFLALFPLVAVALGVTSVLSRIAPSVDHAVREQLARLFPSLDVDSLARDGIAVGVIGLVVLGYAGVRWVSSLRRSVSLMWKVEPRSIGFFAGLTRDVVALALLGGCLLASVALTLVTQLATDVVGRWMGFDGRPSAVIVHVLVLVAALAANYLVGWVLFRALPHGPTSARALVNAAVTFAVGFQVLIQLITVIIAHASSNVVYGTFAATVGVLVWISYVSRMILLIAAWTATTQAPTSVPTGTLGS